MTENAIVVQQGSFISPAVDVHTALIRYQAVKDFIGKVLVEGRDYGLVPNSDKPTLFKPGAEKMCAFFGFEVIPVLLDRIEDWTGKDHDGEPFFYYRYAVQLWRDGRIIAQGEGSCNSWEKKYRYRQQDRKCPACGKETIIKGKKEYGGGWLCYTKKGGCGAKFVDNAPEIVGQVTGQIKNPDPADLVNTLQKMAQKRALVAPVLIATNTSDYFTQDVEDFIDGTVVEEPPTPTIPPPAPAPAMPPMTYDEACSVTNSEGVPYGELSVEKLGHMARSINKRIKDNHLEEPELLELRRKLQAITVIQDHDNG